MYQLVDFVTKKPVVARDFVFVGEDSPWEVQMDLGVMRSYEFERFKTIPPSPLKYLPLLPVKDSIPLLSITDTATPLVESRVLGKQLGVDLYFKVEGKNPTGSFKDRGSAIEIAVAYELGAKAIVLASTGNMAASCACYAAIAKIPCFVLVNESVPLAKLAQTLAFGAHILKVRGSFNDAAMLAKKVAKKIGLYLAGDYAFRVEGQKTAIFEILDQLSFEIPDIIIVPMGCGTNIAAYAKGLYEYHALGFIKKIPKLIGVEVEGANAIVRSYQKQLQYVQPLESVATMASAIAVPYPVDGVKALAAITTTQGEAIAVSDTEMLAAKYQLSSEEGLFVESASATTLAALKQCVLRESWSEKKVLCILTGDGLKDPQLVFEQAQSPAVIEPDEEAFLNFYQQVMRE